MFLSSSSIMCITPLLWGLGNNEHTHLSPRIERNILCYSCTWIHLFSQQLVIPKVVLRSQWLCIWVPLHQLWTQWAVICDMRWFPLLLIFTNEHCSVGLTIICNLQDTVIHEFCHLSVVSRIGWDDMLSLRFKRIKTRNCDDAVSAS